MLKNVSKFVMGSAVALVAMSAPSAIAGEEWEVSGNVAYVSDYLFRGASLSGNEFAIQGGIDVGHSSGFYVGTWASSIEQDLGVGETELDLYGGYGWEAGGLGFDVGVIGYFYPDGDDANYYELYGSVGGEAGIAGWTVGAAYAPDQDNLGNDELYYVYGDVGVPLGESGFELGLHAGYEDGAYATEKTDWAVSLGTSYAGVDLSVAYAGFDDDAVGDDDTVVFTIGKSM